MTKTDLTAKEIRQLEKQLNFTHQDIYSMKPHQVEEYITLLLRLQKEA